MKTVASFFSWAGGILSTVSAMVLLRNDSYVNLSKDSTLIRVIIVIAFILRFMVLVWRQISVEHGHKVLCGVCTLIFASVIGGILTLSIPDDELYSVFINSSVHKTTELTPEQKQSKIEINRNLYNKGVISRNEFERRAREIDPNFRMSQLNAANSENKREVSSDPVVAIENERIEMIAKYKKLLDDGAITQEEFDAKKAELLKQ